MSEYDTAPSKPDFERPGRDRPRRATQPGDPDRPDVKTATPVETQHITATCRENKTHYVAWEHAVHLLRHVYDAQVARDPSATISIAVYRTSNPDSGATRD